MSSGSVANTFNLAASAVRNDRRLIAVVVGGATSRARDAKMVALLDKGVISQAEYDRAQAQATVIIDQEFARKRDAQGDAS